VQGGSLYKLYGELKRLEDEMLLAAPSGSRQDYVDRLNRLEGRASQLSVPTPFRPLVYGLRLHIDMVRQQIEKCIPPEPQSSPRYEPIESRIARSSTCFGSLIGCHFC
jgi:hypothetical protein